MDKKVATQKQIEYATAIAELTGLELPDFSDIRKTSNFITKNRSKYYAIKNTTCYNCQFSDYFGEGNYSCIFVSEFAGYVVISDDKPTEFYLWCRNPKDIRQKIIDDIKKAEVKIMQ
jgi:hypothetical protein